jgi:DNA processing protein
MHTVDSSEMERHPPLTISIDDERYPPLLREIHDPPQNLYVRGNYEALQQPQVAIVGSRRASSAGLRLAQQLAGALGQADLQTCSGLALGIDGAAHEGGMNVGKETVAVVATGIDAVYPKRHVGLAQRICDQGCVVTEFPLGTPPRRENFPQRNRIISGLSMGVVVVEAALASGSLITARAALEQGREVFALPWSPLHEGGAGCLRLLQDGAKLVTSVEDILEELVPLYTLANPENPKRVQHGERKAEDSGLLQLLGFETISLDDLVRESARPVSEVMGALTQLELEMKVVRVEGGYIRA